MSALERKAKVLASVTDEDLRPGTNWRGILRGYSQLAWRLDFPEAYEQVPEDPIVTREEPQVSCRN